MSPAPLATPAITLAEMRTLLPDPPPAEFEALLERRRRSGADPHDEVWEGVLHVTPSPRGRHDDVQQQIAELLGPPARRAGLLPTIGGFSTGRQSKSTDRRRPTATHGVQLRPETPAQSAATG